MKRISLSKNTVIYLIGGVLAAGGNILLAPVYLRNLSPEDYGLWSQFILMTQIFQPIMGWGLMAAFSRIMIDLDFHERGEKIASALYLSAFLNLTILFLVAEFICSEYFLSLAISVRSELILFAALQAALQVYPSILMGLYIADGEALKFRFLSLIGFVLQSALLATCIISFEFNLRFAIISAIISNFLYALISIYNLQKNGKWRASAASIRSLIAFGAPVALYALLGQLPEYVIRFSLSEKLVNAQFGVFSAGLIYSSILSMISSAINLAWVPIFYRHAQEWISSEGYNQYIKVYTTIMAICGIALIGFYKEIMTVFSGGNPILETSTVSILVINSWLGSSVWMSLTNPLFQKKRTMLITGIVSVTVPPIIASSLPLIKYYEMNGASVALLFNSLFLCIGAGLALRFLKMRNIEFIKIFQNLGILMLASILFSGVVHAQQYHELNLQVRILIVLSIAFVSVYRIKSSAKALWQTLIKREFL